MTLRGLQAEWLQPYVRAIDDNFDVGCTNAMIKGESARLTSAFSENLGNLKVALTLHFAWYDSCRIHLISSVTPGTPAGVASEIWSLENLLA